MMQHDPQSNKARNETKELLRPKTLRGGERQPTLCSGFSLSIFQINIWQVTAQLVRCDVPAQRYSHHHFHETVDKVCSPRDCRHTRRLETMEVWYEALQYSLLALAVLQ